MANIRTKPESYRDEYEDNDEDDNEGGCTKSEGGSSDL
jgi:hypothetical protein